MSSDPSSRPRPSTEAKYRAAVELYRTTRLSVSLICKSTGVKATAFRSYLQRRQRELLLARYGIRPDATADSSLRLRHPRGQTPAAHAKYAEAIRACDDERWIALNVSQIARLFQLDPSSLGNQLRAHYPEILERRETERLRRGLNDNLRRGVRPQSQACYAEAVELLRTSDRTIAEVAAECGVSSSGLQEHLLFYHRAVVQERAARREQARSQQVRGALTGNGSCYRPAPACEAKYREAVHLYASTVLTQQEIAARTGVSIGGLRNHLHRWHPELVYARYGLEYRAGTDGTNGVCGAGKSGNRAGGIRFQAKSYRAATAAKYAEAIARLRDSGLPTAQVAAEFGLHTDCFRAYLREHEPALHARQGMEVSDTGRRVSRRSREKYAEAIRLYGSTAENLKSIARRLGICYNSLGGFIRRNAPEVIARHRALCAKG